MTYHEWMPPEIIPIVKEFHSRPQIWFIGQIIKYLLRLNDKMAQNFEITKKNIFGNMFPSTMLGIHARGDDSKTERDIIYLDEFIKHIPKEYKTIYLATDDANNIEITKK